MPYITPAERPHLRAALLPLTERISTKAHLCYAVATLMRVYTEHHPSWSGMSDAIAAVECAKLDFYAMVVQPYEEKKKQENGDIP